jgi:hypothetical protein
VQNAHETSPADTLPVLVATRETQGRRRTDFCWCEDSEPVRFTFECDGETVDGPCGCRRSMSGMVTLKATTTFRVKRLPISRKQFVDMLRDSYAKAGFPLDNASIQEEADELLRLAAAFLGDAVLEKRGGKMQTRG